MHRPSRSATAGAGIFTLRLPAGLDRLRRASAAVRLAAMCREGAYGSAADPFLMRLIASRILNSESGAPSSRNISAVYSESMMANCA